MSTPFLELSETISVAKKNSPESVFMMKFFNQRKRNNFMK